MNTNNFTAYIYKGDRHFSLLQPLIAAYESGESASLKLECKTNSIVEIREVLFRKPTQ